MSNKEIQEFNEKLRRMITEPSPDPFSPDGGMRTGKWSIACYTVESRSVV